MDVGQNSAIGDGDRAQQLGQLLVVTDSQLQPTCNNGPQAAEKAPAKKAAPAKTAEGKKKAKKMAKAETYKIYIYKVLKQVHPDTGISSKAMGILNSFNQRHLRQDRLRGRSPGSL
eukprot:gene6363-biopygen1511